MVTISAGYFLSASSLCRAVFSSNGMSATTTVLMLSSMYSLTPWPLLYADQTRQVNFRGFPKKQKSSITAGDHRLSRASPLLCVRPVCHSPESRDPRNGRRSCRSSLRSARSQTRRFFSRPGCDAEGWPSTRSGTTYIPGSEIRRSQYL
jgi:hypothetical protein